MLVRVPTGQMTALCVRTHLFQRRAANFLTEYIVESIFVDNISII